jgi:fructokinase
MRQEMKLFGGIEAGGTKFICMVAASPDQIIAETRIPTTTADETIRRTIDFFSPFALKGELAAVGIGSFGPVDLNLNSPTYGFITTTPKPEWSFTDLLGGLKRALQIPVAFDTDVNAAAFGECYWIAENKNLDPLLYVTIGTGIGVGAIANGKPVHGLVHTEGGHLSIPHDKKEDPYTGYCPYHGDCWEGLATGPALASRWGKPANLLEDDHPGWDLEAKYIALAFTNLIYLYSPMRIVMGGGVLQHKGLLQKVQLKTQQLLNGYVQSDMILNHIDHYIVSPGLGTRSGVLGAIAFARELAN